MKLFFPTSYLVLLEKHKISFPGLFVLFFFLPLAKTEKKVIFDDESACVSATTGHECL